MLALAATSSEASGSLARVGRPRRRSRADGGGSWTCVRRASRQLAVRANAFGGGDPSLLTLPVFPLPNVLHPTQQGVLTVFEPQYLAMFRSLLEGERASGSAQQEAPLPQPAGQGTVAGTGSASGAARRGAGGRFIHVLSPAAAPPALLENAVGGLPRIGCCAEVQEIQERLDGTLLVQYTGSRRVQLLLPQQTEQPFTTVAAEWFDDDPVGELDPTVDVLEREAAKLLQQIERLTALLTPGEGALPEAVRQYCPPAGVKKQTSYDALKAAGHRAAGHIEMWRRHGSAYKAQGRPAAAAAATDPYDAVREALSKHRRQELFSFAAAQLLVMGTPERAALLLSQDTGARLNFVLAALRPYFLELQAKASLKRSLD